MLELLPIIDEIWIMREDNGNLMFHQRISPQQGDPQLISSFITALNGMCEVMGMDKIEKIEALGHRFLFSYNSSLNMYIVVRSNLHVPSKKIKKLLKKISYTFFSECLDDIKRFTRCGHAVTKKTEKIVDLTKGYNWTLPISVSA